MVSSCYREFGSDRANIPYERNVNHSGLLRILVCAPRTDRTARTGSILRGTSYPNLVFPKQTLFETILKDSDYFAEA